MSDFDFSDKTKELFGDPEAFTKTPDFDKMLNGDMVGYDSPIQIIASQIEMTMDGEILKACQRVGVDVNKAELVKALEYDRGQYEQGYKNGYKDGYAKGIEDCLAKIGTIVKGGDPE